MKSLFSSLAVVSLLIVSLSVSSCGSAAKLENSATWQKLNFTPFVTPVQVDLKVSPTKVNYFMLVSETVRNGGYDNVVSTAVREALAANGDADVMVGLQTQIKYNDNGEIESIEITGFPAKYVNWRNREGGDVAMPAPAQPAPALPSLGKKGLFKK